MGNKKIDFFFIILFLLVFTGNISCRSKDETFKKPESFIIDTETGEYFVSNVNGIPLDRDKNGYITKLDKDLKVINKEFIKGTADVELHAPKGMAIIGDVLYVTDISNLRAYNKKTGENVADIDLKDRGAIFLNDIIADKDGNLYVSDMTANIIYKVETQNENKVSVFCEGEQLDQPNGLMIHPQTGDLLVAAWGGKFLSIDKDGKVSAFLDDKKIGLDGIDYDNDGNIYVSSFQEGEIYKITPDKKITTIKKGLKTPADISVDRKKGLLLIPFMSADKIETMELKGN